MDGVGDEMIGLAVAVDVGLAMMPAVGVAMGPSAAVGAGIRIADSGIGVGDGEGRRSWAQLPRSNASKASAIPALSCLLPPHRRRIRRDLRIDHQARLPSTPCQLKINRRYSATRVRVICFR